ncbi:hypothetical protein GGS24DRAFT_477466 [Hypoxylon argillaceum]|nr:hypothetical protein GGS24DRAFT_477466 [Hypoxylon argillaceum]
MYVLVRGINLLCGLFVWYYCELNTDAKNYVSSSFKIRKYGMLYYLRPILVVFLVWILTIMDEL